MIDDRDPPKAERGEALGPNPPPDRHWSGFAGQGEAQSYPVIDRGRYALLLTLLLLAFILTGIAVMLHGERRSPVSSSMSPSAPAVLAPG